MSTSALRRIDTLSRETTLSNLFCLPSDKGSILERKKFAPVGSKVFLSKEIPFAEGDWYVGDQNRKLPLPPAPPFINDRKSTENLSNPLSFVYHFCIFSKISVPEMVYNASLLLEMHLRYSASATSSMHRYFDIFCDDIVS